MGTAGQVDTSDSSPLTLWYLSRRSFQSGQYTILTSLSLPRSSLRILSFRYQDRVAPWVHYIPVQNNYSDLYDILIFFRGDHLNGEGDHDDLAHKIATAGRIWSKKFWRKEDLTAYLFRYAAVCLALLTFSIQHADCRIAYRLFLEYARVMSLDREAMSYVD
jgi:hypothetical protein